jgi:hypothetical protein
MLLLAGAFGGGLLGLGLGIVLSSGLLLFRRMSGRRDAL